MNQKLELMTRPDFMTKKRRKAPSFMNNVGWNSGGDKKAKKEFINIISNFAKLPLN